MPTDRPVLRAPLDEDTYDRWHDFADAHGVPISALAEAIGRQLVTTGRLPAWQRQAVTDARTIWAHRKDRRPTD